MGKTNQQSPAFSSFRKFMDLRNNCAFQENVSNEIEKVLANKKILFFFKHKDKAGTKLFGTDDSNRMIYAMWKNPSKSDPDTAIESFQAYDLEGIFQNKHDSENERIRLFNKKDLPKISVVTDKDEVLDLLSKKTTGDTFQVKKQPVSKGVQIIKDKKNERK